MTQAITMLVCLGAFVWSFFDPIWAWLPIGVVIAFLGVTLLAVRQKRWKQVPELSAAANEMIQRFGHRYFMPFAARDFSGACSTVQFGAIAVAIVAAFKGNWWGVPTATILWFVMGPMSMAFDPTNFIRGTPLERPHAEVFEWLERQMEARRKPRA